MPRKIIEKEYGSSKARSHRATVGSYPVLDPAIRSKVGSVKLAEAVKKVWAEKHTSTTDAIHSSEPATSSAGIERK